jgi:hypothetical protein
MSKKLFVFVFPTDDRPDMVVNADSLEAAVNYYVEQHSNGDEYNDARYVKSILKRHSEVRVYYIDDDSVRYV